MVMKPPPEFQEWDFRLRRFQNWIILGFLYSFFYMSRYNFSAIMPTMQNTFGWNNTDLGMFDSVMALIYGLSVVINGPIADRIGGKKAFMIGAAGVIVMNFLFGSISFFMVHPAQWQNGHLVASAAFTHGLTPKAVLILLLVVWGANGYFQSFGALSIVKVNAQWFHIRERGTFAAIFGILIRFGLILAFSGVPWIVEHMSWQWAFWIPAMFVLILFVLNGLFVQNTPKDAGYPGRDTGDAVLGADDDSPVPIRLILKKVFTTRVMWTIALSSMMIGFIRRATVDSWYPQYFKQFYHVQNIGGYVYYQITAWGIALMGILGGFAFGISSDRIFGGRRGPVVTIGFIGMTVVMLLFLASDAIGLGPLAAAILLMTLSFFVNGSHGMIGGAASMDFGGRKAAATAAGLFDGMQYLAGAFVGVGVGYITDHYGWQAWKLWPIPFTIIGAILMGTLWNTLPKGRKETEQAKSEN